MSDSFNQRQDAKPIPHITSLSTAYPLQFDSDDREDGKAKREDASNPAPARRPHRHDAGE